MLILASESPRRRALLTKLGIPFEIKSAQVTELEQTDAVCSVSLLPQMNAELKARAVSLLHPEDIVIGADTAIIFEDQMIGKPRDLDDARRILRELSGKTHQVITGIAVLRGGAKPLQHVWSEVSDVSFKNLSSETIEEYIRLVHVLDKAGAYAIQEHGDMIISACSGDMDNIIGLPLPRLSQLLEQEI